MEMAENDMSVIIIEDNETQANTSEVIDLDSTEDGEIAEEISNPSPVATKKQEFLATNFEVPTVIELSPEPAKAATKVSTPVKPTFEIIFRDSYEYEKLSEAVLKALKKSETVGEPKFEYVSSQGSIQAFGLETFIDEEATQSDNDSNDSIDFGADLNKLFTIDAKPSEKLEITEVPSYKRHSRDVLDDESKPKQVKKDDNHCPRPRPTAACFNCGMLEHSLRNCPKPRNQDKIARAKRAHASKGERYHVDVDQRFAHIQPGQISDKLKRALNLRKHELPSFFYRMREFGYPPGWLEVAKVSHSGLAMFNTNEDVLKQEEDSNEAEIKYDISKIVEFPGFNVMPETCRDDYKLHNVRPYSELYSKERMIAALGNAAIKGFRRKKLKDHTEGSTALQNETNTSNMLQDTAQNEEMEIDDDEVVEENVEFTRPMPPPMPSGEENEVPPLPPAETEAEEGELLETVATAASENDTTRSTTKSPSLEELQAQQRALMLKLANGTDDSQVKNDLSAPTTPLPETPKTPTAPAASSTQTQQHVIKTTHLTPVFKFQPYDKIPSTENFKAGLVGDVINFENLPDSTGKYENMKEIISKVRIAKKKLAQEDD